MRSRFAFLLLCVLVWPSSRVQSQSSNIVDDQILRVVNSVNDLRFADAIRDGQEILSAAGTLRPNQETTLRFALAAAYFPEINGAPMPDNALEQFLRVLRIAPDAELPEVFSWPGLDSLFAVARSRELFVAMRPTVDSFSLLGTANSPSIAVVASRPARFRLSTRRIGGAEVTHSASSTPSARVELTLRATDGSRVLLERGEYDLVLTAVDVERGDSTQTMRRLRVEGDAPTLSNMPVLDGTRLRPDQLKPTPWRIAATGGAMALATFVIADQMRATGRIATESNADSRAGIIGLSIIGATGWAIWKDRKGIDQDAAEANAAVRALHQRAVAAAESENAQRLSAHRVTVRLIGEGR